MQQRKVIRCFSIIFSCIFFILAVIVAISMSLALFKSYGAGDPVFLQCMTAIFSVYKFSSFLLPVIFLYASIVLVMPGWNKHSRALLFALPLVFFACVAGEYTYHVILSKIQNPTIYNFARWAMFLSMLFVICAILIFSHLLADRFFKTQREEIIYHAEIDIIAQDYHDIEWKDGDKMQKGEEPPPKKETFFSLFKVEEDKSIPSLTTKPEIEPIEMSTISTKPIEIAPTLVKKESIELKTLERSPTDKTISETVEESELMEGEDIDPIMKGQVLSDTPINDPVESESKSEHVKEPQEEIVKTFEQKPFETSSIETKTTVAEEKNETMGIKENEETSTRKIIPSAPVIDSHMMPPVEEVADKNVMEKIEVENNLSALEPATPPLATKVEVLQSAPEPASDIPPAMVAVEVQPSTQTPASEVPHSVGVLPSTPEPVSETPSSITPIENPSSTQAPKLDPPPSIVPIERSSSTPIPKIEVSPAIEKRENTFISQVDNAPTVEDKKEIVDEFKTISETEVEKINNIEVISVKPAESTQKATQDEKKGYHIPFDLLKEYPGNDYWIIDSSTRRSAFALKSTLNEFKISVEITGIRKGPVVTMFEVLPPPGIKLAKITALQDNIALRLAAESVRIVAPIPGKRAVGIEIPNEQRSIVGFRELIEVDNLDAKKMAIPIVLGKDITGEMQTIDLSQTPHLLIAGATGAGKSVCVNSIILSILYNNRPDEVKLLLVDPKIVELKLYNDIPHLLTPVITEPKKAFQALQYCICEMERRYAFLDRMSVRDIKSYNKKIKAERLTMERLPYIVIIIDEFADLMATTGKELEGTVSRLCAMSRAVGIHLVLATQRPSTDVITGLIKANIPSRIAFMVASRIDSRIILDDGGADKLLGKGDMLYVSPARPWPTRIQGAFVSEDEVEHVVEHVKTFGEPDYIDDEIFMDDNEEPVDSFFGGESDPLYDEALDIVLNEGKASASYIQRRLKIGYNRAARIIEEMEERGVVGPANGSKARDILQQF